jgi:hypothetical protein
MEGSPTTQTGFSADQPADTPSVSSDARVAFKDKLIVVLFLVFALLFGVISVAELVGALFR